MPSNVKVDAQSLAKADRMLASYTDDQIMLATGCTPMMVLELRAMRASAPGGGDAAREVAPACVEGRSAADHFV